MKETNGRRSAMFLLFVLWTCYPLMREAFRKTGTQRVELLQHFAKVFAASATALFFYCSRLPEAFVPGNVDVLLHSHTIWHLFVSVLFTKLDGFAKYLVCSTQRATISRDQTWMCLCLFYTVCTWDASTFYAQLAKQPKFRARAQSA